MAVISFIASLQWLTIQGREADCRRKVDSAIPAFRSDETHRGRRVAGAAATRVSKTRASRRAEDVGAIGVKTRRILANSQGSDRGRWRDGKRDRHSCRVDGTVLHCCRLLSIFLWDERRAASRRIANDATARGERVGR